MKCFFVQYFDNILCFLYCCWIVIDSPHKPRELQCTTVSKGLRDGQVLRDTCPPKCSSNAMKWVKVQLLQSNPASQILNSVHPQNFMGKRMLNTIHLTQESSQWLRGTMDNPLHVKSLGFDSRHLIPLRLLLVIILSPKKAFCVVEISPHTWDNITTCS